MKRVQLSLVIGMLCGLSTVTLVCAQTGTVQGTRGRTDPVQRELQRRFESEAIEQVLAEGPRHRGEPHRRRILTQIKEDFLRLQVVDDELRKFTSSTGSIDLETVAKSASEISKLAKRLKDNLALPQIEELAGFSESRAKTEIDQMRLSLLVLSSAIDAFVENPLFEKAGVVDVQLSIRARRDLQQIIEISARVKIDAERLKRARS